MTIKTTALSRILNQWADCEKWEKFISIWADYFDDLMDAIIYLQTQTWLDTAQGVWMDRIGEIVGVSRPAGEEIERVFRCRGDDDPEYDPLHGFGGDDPETGEVDPDMGGLIWGEGGIPTGTQASDGEFLDFIMAKIAATNADASVPGIAKYITAAFGISSTVTATPGLVSVELLEEVDLRQRRYLETFAPALAGVSFLITNWPDWETL